VRRHGVFRQRHDGALVAGAALAVHGSVPLQWIASQQPLVREAKEGGRAITKHDMVDKGNAEQLPCVHEPLREGTIFPAGRRVAARVVVAAEDGSGVGQDGRFEDFPHMHDARSEAADRDRVEADGRVFAVQQDDDEMLAVYRTQILPQERGGVHGTPEARRRSWERRLPHEW